MKRIIKDYFTFSKRELSGIIVLLFLIVIIAILPKIVSHYTKEGKSDFSSFEKEISEFEYKIAQKEKAKNEKQLFVFDPNKVTKAQLLKLGFTEKQASTLYNYRKAGGVFQTKTDLKKVYGISNKMFRELEPFIAIKPKKEILKQDSDVASDTLKKELALDTAFYNFIVELNTADSLELLKLPGIGATFSRRICNYREFLGGFYTSDQLLEVYGISENTIEKIKSHVTIDTTLMLLIDINNADFKTLNKHPYINYKQTKAIFKYLDLMKEFKRKDDILKNNLMDSISFRKIKPYLIIQPKIDA